MSSRERSSSHGSLAESMSWDGSERRRHRRLGVDWKGGLVQTSSRARARMDVRVVNISEGGCCVHIDPSPDGEDRSFILGAEERFGFTLAAPDGVVKSVVEVRWYVPSRNHTYVAGLEFVAMSQADRSILRSAIRKLSS